MGEKDITYSRSSGNQFCGRAKLAKHSLAGRIDHSKKNNYLSCFTLHFKGDHVLFTRPFQQCNGTSAMSLHRNTRWLNRS